MLTTAKVFQEFYRAEKLMGNSFGITVVGETRNKANEQIDKAIKEIQRIESFLSTFKEDSETNIINRNAGTAPVKVSAEMIALVKRAERISVLTGGAFDISYGSVDKSLWNFDKSMTALPAAETALAAVRLINFRNIVVDDAAQTICLKEKGMRIGFGGIGKGYAAEMAKALLQKEGVQNGIVNASGDMTAWGMQANGKKWTIGIADPDNAALPFSAIEITDMAVATSGNYEKFVMINGKKYSHTINPRTGLPVRGIKSVTILSPNAEIADALATPVTIMGVKSGISLVNQINGVECIVIDDNNNIYCSKNINLQ